MISRKDIENLAELSRLKLSDTELAGLEKDFPAILEYVGQIQGSAGGNAVSAASSLHNVMRDDTPGGGVGGSREALLEAAPRREGDFIVVRKIISRDEPSV